MSGLLGFRASAGSCLPAWCMAKTLFASMQLPVREPDRGLERD